MRGAPGWGGGNSQALHILRSATPSQTAEVTAAFGQHVNKKSCSSRRKMRCRYLEILTHSFRCQCGQNSVGTGYRWTSVVQNYNTRKDLITHMQCLSLLVSIIFCRSRNYFTENWFDYSLLLLQLLPIDISSSDLIAQCKFYCWSNYQMELMMKLNCSPKRNSSNSSEHWFRSLSCIVG